MLSPLGPSMDDAQGPRASLAGNLGSWSTGSHSAVTTNQHESMGALMVPPLPGVSASGYIYWCPSWWLSWHHSFDRHCHLLDFSNSCGHAEKINVLSSFLLAAQTLYNHELSRYFRMYYYHSATCSSFLWSFFPPQYLNTSSKFTYKKNTSRIWIDNSFNFFRQLPSRGYRGNREQKT